ncbi:arylesterase [Thalassobaculum sp. OXR-137]|uniref:arylesterase n=1 Tax=Thalassobaculum sp. OXR-137 TaxID=3100173 RepID=UPI002AC99219|nr:arylesterase [Thalassobaculum sp. OXR-137]WPZ35073.1 arylesterase [Thalassobaculum sp. OXR-137]
MRRINAVLRFAAGIAILSLTLAGPAAAETIRILGFGDSLMAGYGLADEDAFPTRLQAALQAAGHDVIVINAGVSGDTTAGGAARLAWSLSEAPDAAIVELGANDGLRGIPTADTRQNLDAILTALGENDIPVLFAGMYAPPNMGKEYGADFAAVFEDLAAQHEVIFYPFFLDGVAGDLALNQADGIHPNRAGVDILVERILPYAEKLVVRAKGE